MDGYSYYNIFETKGIEYLIIIAFLLMIIPFWISINRRNVISKQIRSTYGRLSPERLKIPLGLLFNRNHTWAHLEKSGNARIGMDDFLVHITGEVKLKTLRNSGDIINRGDLLAEINQNGKHLSIFSPLSGQIVVANTELNNNPGILNDDPYGEGWIFSIKPSGWKAETSSFFLAGEAIAWSKTELERFKDFMAESLRKYTPETSMVILQDGGELCDQPLSELPNEVWQDFQKSFLN